MAELVEIIVNVHKRQWCAKSIDGGTEIGNVKIFLVDLIVFAFSISSSKVQSLNNYIGRQYFHLAHCSLSRLAPNDILCKKNKTFCMISLPPLSLSVCFFRLSLRHILCMD